MPFFLRTSTSAYLLIQGVRSRQGIRRARLRPLPAPLELPDGHILPFRGELNA
jgi:hypothetical protein